MRTNAFVVVTGCLLCACGFGCASAKPSIWPSNSDKKWIYYHPEPMESTDEAIGTIRNLEQEFVSWESGINFSSLDIDAYGLRAKWEWTEVTEQTNYVPSYGGFFSGATYVPVYGGSYQTQTYSTDQSDMLVIPFDQVKMLTLYHMPNLDRPFKHGLVVGLDGKAISLRVADGKKQFQLANAIFTLATARHAEIFGMNVGLGVNKLTLEQRQVLGLQDETGLLVTNVAVDGPAEKAGILFLDVLLGVDDQSITNSTGIKPITEAIEEANGEPVSIKLIRREMGMRSITNEAGEVIGEQEGEVPVTHTVKLSM